MPSHEPAAAPVRGEQSSAVGQGDRHPSVSDVLASCQAANAVSTPPDPSEPENAEGPEEGAPEERRPDAA
ncbi:hypothetical protein [Streptomyces meridianus]|uniref:Uncharacterized protein n=1 Tax=Streptomyces meridianus TaxID=2938945 RepID=A0ABT0XDB1_9ACTN|nr:hypothetical protein [Streptomyces meridianus]MCM2580512.1 hypothetical protein [Streptomyces meridianus]